MKRLFAPPAALSALGAYALMITLMSTAPALELPLPLLQPADLIQPAGVRLEAQLPRPGLALLGKDPRRSSLWNSPDAARTLADGTVQLWYRRVDKNETNYLDQRTLCLGEIRDGKLVLPEINPTPPPWGGPNNVVMRHSPHKPTWGAFNCVQIAPANAGLGMIYWDQPGKGPAGAMCAFSHDGKSWEKMPDAVFTEYNDALCMARIGNEFLVYQTALQPWPDKPVPDNLDKVKRVITLRTSPDLKNWSRQQPLLAPDASDACDTEFYIFKVFCYGRGYAGLLMKYYADPAMPGKHSNTLRYELAVSKDGRAWQRPYRDTNLGFWTYADPFVLAGRLHFAVWKDTGIATLAYGEGRLVAAVGPGSFRTLPFNRPNKGLALNADTSDGWLEVTPCDGAGEPVRGVKPQRLEKADGQAIPLPWKKEILPAVCSLRIELGAKARVFGICADKEANKND